MTKNNVQCKLKTCIRHPYCWIHAKKILNLIVKKSTIENAGCGLFTTADIRKDAKICEYEGEILHKQINENSQYTMKLKHNLFIDATCLRGIGAMANAKKTLKACNAKLTTNNTRTKGFLKATHNIKSGAEIFLYYGDTFSLK